ncbi:hypothetical protein [Nitrososphaera sp.]|uniref:hypothetical protein n=1 Tax=Nitrososphaera sp. TaxID=1971748 RepID=UPI00307D88A2
MEHSHYQQHSGHDEQHQHGSHGDEEPVIVKKLAPNEELARDLNDHGVMAEPLALGKHPLEHKPYYSHKFAMNPRFATNRGMIRIRGKNFDLVQVVQKH